MKTPLNAYASTPHKTITELAELATARTFAGENPAAVKQDIIDGYGLGWQSANAALIETAADKGAEMERAIPMKRAEKFTPGPWLIADSGNNHGDGDVLTVWVERAETLDTCENPDICRVFQIDGDMSKTKFANARLIAASPKLFAALVRLETAARHRDNTMGDPCRLIEVTGELKAAAEEARAVIAEATKGGE